MARTNITALEKQLTNRNFVVTTRLIEPTMRSDGTLQAIVEVSASRSVTLLPDEWSTVDSNGRRRRRNSAQIQSAVDAVLKAGS